MPDAARPASFTMYGARAAAADGLMHVQEQINAIEQAVIQQPGLAFDLAKTLIESVCKTILNERAIVFAADDDLPKLFKLVSRSLPFLPSGVSTEVSVRNSLARTLSGLHTAVQGVCELRNACGFASHGGDGTKPRLETVQAVLAAESADTIVGFLYKIHRQDGAKENRRLNYDANIDFNAYVNDSYDKIKIFAEEFDPSWILYSLAPEPYRLYLTEFETQAAEEGGEKAFSDGVDQ